MLVPVAIGCFIIDSFIIDFLAVVFFTIGSFDFFNKSCSNIFFITGQADCVVSVFPNVRTARKISNTLQKKTPKAAVIMLLFIFCFVLAAGFKNKRNSIGLPHTKRIYPFRRLCIAVS